VRLSAAQQLAITDGKPVEKRTMQTGLDPGDDYVVILTMLDTVGPDNEIHLSALVRVADQPASSRAVLCDVRVMTESEVKILNQHHRPPSASESHTIAGKNIYNLLLNT
jgi:hypothetical protein